MGSIMATRLVTNRRPPLHSWTLLAVALVLVSACSTITVNLMPAPEGFLLENVEAFKGTPEAQRNLIVPVLYATNRVPGKKSKDGSPYGNNYDDTLRMGLAKMRIGDDPSLQWEDLKRLSVQEQREQDLPLRLIDVNETMSLGHGQDLEAPPEDIRMAMDQLNQVLANSRDPDLLIFVHGARNTFYRAVGQASQYRHFTGRNTVVLAFAWPSTGSLLYYGTDVRRARKSARQLADLVELLARHSTARKINILGYSLGGVVVSNALALLREDHADETSAALAKGLRIGEVYYAAADIDTSEFTQQLKAYHEMVDRVTMTVNLNDSVLKMSQFRNRSSRIGRPDADELDSEETKFLIEASATDNFDVIDAVSAVSLFDALEAHDYWYNNPRVSTDVLMKMLFHLGPADRGLKSIVTERGFTVWYFPDDYHQRVSAAIDELEY
jgi:esterase/lipase superfamily enzyme